MKDKRVSDLVGTELDYWVAIANGWQFTLGGANGDEPAWLLSDGKSRIAQSNYTPTTDWGQAGPIIERLKIELGPSSKFDLWFACVKIETTGRYYLGYGESALLAAMRCYVCSVLTTNNLPPLTKPIRSTGKV